MDFADYNTGLFAGLLTNMADDAPGNHSSVSHFDGLFGGMDGAASSNGNHSQNPQHLVTFLQHFFSKMSDNQSALHIPSSMSAARSSTGVLSPASSLPASSNDANTSHVLAILSLWFVLIVNPIVVRIVFLCLFCDSRQTSLLACRSSSAWSETFSPRTS